MIERTFYKKESKLYLACNDKKAFFTSAGHYRGYHLWSCQNVYDALSFLLDNIYIRFGTKLYRQIVGIPMGTNCAPLVADYAPNFEKVDGAYCFWSVRACVRGCVRASHFLYLL